MKENKLKNKNLKEKYPKIISLLFFIFFMTPILSPSIAGLTVYIHWFIPLLDVNFIKYVFEIAKKIFSNKKYAITIILGIIVVCVCVKFKFILEVGLIVESIIYLIYSYKINTFKYAYWAINFNIFIAIIQFVLYYISPDMARAIGPTNIAHLIWGEHATATYTNIYPDLLKIVKVSGWSREAGFFNSLVIMSAMVYHYVDKKTAKHWCQYGLFAIGFIISLSKISLLPLIIIPIIALKKYIDKIPYIVGVALVIIGGIFTSNFLLEHNQYDNRYSNNYETFSHRFGGYTVMTQLDFKDLVVGINTLDDLPEEVKQNNEYLKYIYRFHEFCGLPAMVVHYGIPIFLVFIICLKLAGFKTSDFWILTIFTITVNYATLTSFVILGYFMILYFISKRDKKYKYFEIEEKDKNKCDKILIVNDYLIAGGAEQYALNLRSLLKENGHDVYFLSFDSNFEEKVEKLEDKEKIYNIKGKSKLNKLIFNPILYSQARKIINAINPDKIIINNIFLSPITQIVMNKDYYTYQVVHDYGKICPKSTCIKDNGELCNGYKFGKCTKECKYHNSSIKTELKLILCKITEGLTKKYMNNLISPSECLNSHLKEFGYNTRCLNNPIEIEDLSQSDKNKGFLYVGNICDNKGIFRFIEIFDKISTNLKLDIIGKCKTKEDEERMKELIKNSKNITYIGCISNKKTIQKVAGAYCLVVPSLWIENYPTTILEAKSEKTLIIGSNRGGIPELVNNKEFIFDIDKEETVCNCIEKVCNLSDEEYQKIVDENYKNVKEKNSYRNYYNKFIELIKQ